MIAFPDEHQDEAEAALNSEDEEDISEMSLWASEAPVADLLADVLVADPPAGCCC